MHVLGAVLVAVRTGSSSVGACPQRVDSNMKWMHGTGLECWQRVLLSRRLIGYIGRDATLVKGWFAGCLLLLIVLLRVRAV